MKRLSYKMPALLVLGILLFVTQLFAQEDTRRISKSFNIKADTKIEINNKYGNVIINRWNKNVLELKVKIEAKGKTSSTTQKILDEIEIDISDRISSGKLSIETEIGERGYFVNFVKTADKLLRIIEMLSSEGYNIIYTQHEGLPGGATYHLRISPKQKLEEGVQNA